MVSWPALLPLVLIQVVRPWSRRSCRTISDDGGTAPPPPDRPPTVGARAPGAGGGAAPRAGGGPPPACGGRPQVAGSRRRHQEQPGRPSPRRTPVRAAEEQPAPQAAHRLAPPVLVEGSQLYQARHR